MRKRIQTFKTMEIELVILGYVLKRNGSLSYYQFDRKLSNDNLHSFLPNLRKILQRLVEKDCLKVEFINNVEFYSITENGKKQVGG